MITRIVSCLISLAAGAVADGGDSTADQAARASAIHESWVRDQPQEPSVRLLRVVLWSPADREPQAGVQQRVDGVLRHARDFFARELGSLGLTSATPRWEADSNGLVRIHMARGKGSLSSLGATAASEIREDCFRVLRHDGLNPDRETVLILSDVAQWNEEKSTISRPEAYYAEGNHRRGIAWVVDTPWLDVAHLGNDDAVLHDSALGVLSAADHVKHALFQLCQQLGHAMGLPNDRESPQERESGRISFMNEAGLPLAGRSGSRELTPFIPLADGLRLMVHPLLQGARMPNLSGSCGGVDSWRIEVADGGILLHGVVRSAVPIHAVVAYVDPDGKSDHDARTFSSVPRADGTFSLWCEKPEPGTRGEIRVVVVQADGAASGFMSATPYRYPYRVEPDGTMDLAVAQAILCLTPFASALWQDDSAEIGRLLEEEGIRENPRMMEIACRWMRRKSGEIAESDHGRDSLLLSDLPAVSASTGYGPAVFDRLPGPQPLLISAGRLFGHGMYAHAPSTYSWDLDGTWKVLRGAVGLADGHPGSVSFVIEGDGKALWDRKILRSGELATFEVDVSAVRKLTLKTGDAGDGRGNDWSLWLEPSLGR